MDKQTLKRLIREEIQKIQKGTTNNNIWDSYQMIIFDILPNAKIIEKLIHQALNSGLVNSESKKMWGGNIAKKYAEDLQIPWTFQETPIPSLYIDPEHNGFHPSVDHQQILQKYPSITPIKYSEIS